jgi:uncharacterized membrane protein YbhN (UPF0104 family)
MRLVRSLAAAAALLALTLAGVALLTGAAGAVRSAQLPVIAAAALCYSAGFLVFNAFWAFLLCRLPAGDRPTDNAAVRPARAWRVGLLSLAGLMTPMNLGTDVLRSVFGRRYLGLAVPVTAAASVVTRECKLHVTLVLLPGAAAFTAIAVTEARGRLLAAFAGLLVLALALMAFRSDPAARLARSLRIGPIAEAARDLHRRLHWRHRLVTCAAFAAGFAGEWLALRLCFHALQIPADTTVTMGVFGVLYLLARTPVIPFGIGAVEVGGLAWLRLVQVPAGQAGALIMVWSALRILVPYVLAGAALLTFLVERQGQPQSAEGDAGSPVSTRGGRQAGI